VRCFTREKTDLLLLGMSGILYKIEGHNLLVRIFGGEVVTPLEILIGDFTDGW
jgi:hypothetical protein